MWENPLILQNIGILMMGRKECTIMLYTNKELNIKVRELSFGDLYGVTIGESGRGRHEVFLPTPAGLVGEICGFHTDLTIGTTASGRPRISQRSDQDLYMILSSERGYTRRGCGHIEALCGQDYELLARANGADGEAGRIGTWDAVIVKAHDGAVFRVIWGGHDYGYTPTLFIVGAGGVHRIRQDDAEFFYEKLGIQMPFHLIYNGATTSVVEEEWEMV